MDIDKLLSLCGEYIDNDFEKDKFEWKGKSQCLRLAQKRSTATLHPMPEESVNFDTTQNLYIEGDNLEVLKLLQKSYFRKVKMIYIDPPYNTGNDFVYEDDFAAPLVRYREVTQQTTKSNPETMGRYHTNWLNMMYPRLRLADNLRTAVTKHSKDELVLQSAFADLEAFYDTIILPPPPRKPKGKPTVENHVRFLETHLVETLKKDTYTSLKALNAAAKKIVADINSRSFQKRSDIRETRMNAFEKYDGPRMNMLPGESYTLCDYKYFVKVPDNYHLEYDAHYYSVLYTQLGKPAILKATMTEIRICDEYNRLLCKHPRSYREFPLYVTDDSHMPPAHLYYKEINLHDGDYYRRWASVYGDSMVTVIDRILRSSRHEEQAFNSCAGVLHSCKDVPQRLIQEAADKCIEANACKYSYFKKVLGMVQSQHVTSDASASGALPSHTNIRGKESFK